MKIYTIDGRKLTDPETAHEYLAETLGFPDYYGKNFDALSDCLSDMGIEFSILVNYKAEAIEKLGHWGEILFKVIEDTAAEYDFRVFYGN